MKKNMYNAFVNAITGEVVALIDWVSHATYNAYPLGTNEPTNGDRVSIVDPGNALASPLGWHSQVEGQNFTNTIGNNVFAQDNPDAGTDYMENHRPDGGENLVFDFQIDFTQEPETFIDAATTNLFYWNNIAHDLFHVHGFDETSGNFQHDNFGRGGQEGDAVVAFAQDGGGMEDASFMTPPDGIQGRMRMFLFELTSPRRDSDLDGGIIMHEYVHGMSIRLTGGSANVNCLRDGEAGGMGEGWGDWFPLVTQTTINSTRNDNFVMGVYVLNDTAGVRNYPYSTNMTVNPSTYIFLQKPEYQEIHYIGEVWAVTLYEVYWNLVEKHGFEPDWLNGNSTGGNVVALQLVIDGMKIQPCDPDFIEARDAIFQSDELNNHGDNYCELWRGFAKRGLGVGAVAGSGGTEWDGVESFQLPDSCAET